MVGHSAGFQAVFPVPWKSATTAFWCKYPSPTLAHVKDALVLSRYLDDNGVLHTRRLMHIEQALPSLLKRFSGGLDSYFAIEYSTVDPKNQLMILQTRNLTCQFGWAWTGLAVIGRVVFADLCCPAFVLARGPTDRPSEHSQ